MNRLIINDLKKNYHIDVVSSSSISGGWLNLKWKVQTNKGLLLVKQFDPKRYPKEKLRKVEHALQWQLSIYNQGVKCPLIYTWNGQVIRMLQDNIAYMVMEFCMGEEKNYKTITAAEMYSLGRACGQMHRSFRMIPVNTMDARMEHLLKKLCNKYENCISNRCKSDSVKYIQTLKKQKTILDTLTEEFFRLQPRAIAHQDFAADNILFYKGAVSAIIDFVRSSYSYILQDIGRALLSFTVKDDNINIEFIDAFHNGYTEYLTLSYEMMVNALKISWCFETPWWIQPEWFAQEEGKPTRFRDEIVFVTNHWFELEEIIH